MSLSTGEVDAVRSAVIDDLDSVIAFTQSLVRAPSRGGVDDYSDVLGQVNAWLSERALPSRPLVDTQGRCVGVTCMVEGSHPGRRWVLDACVDTAPFGDESRWTKLPTSGELVDGWLHGRGASDSKVGIAIFCHVAARLAGLRSRMHGDLVLLFDADEHTGGFAGARTYFDHKQPDTIGGVLIGYPGLDKLVVGSRGVFRAAIQVGGVSGHSGSKGSNVNAVEKAAALVTALSGLSLPESTTMEFPVPPKLTVTEIQGGEGFTTVPDLCELKVDVRTTPAFDADQAQALLAATIATLDEAWPTTPSTDLTVDTVWPAYALEPSHQLRSTLLETTASLGLDVQATISGPSNIGNFLAGLGIPATAGFGVAYEGLHGTDERIDTSTIPTVEAVYLGALMRLLGI